MTPESNMRRITLACIVTGLLLISAFFAGCTGTHAQSPAPISTSAATPQLTPLAVTTTAAPVSTLPTALITTSTPAPVYTSAQGTVVAYTAASLKGASADLAKGFSAMYPGRTIVFNLDGTQALKTQVQNGAYADVFISASNAYTTELTKGGYFVDGTVKNLAANYVIVILPANNPAHIQSLKDLAQPGIKIARAAKTVPVGTATEAALANLAKSTYGQDWNRSIWTNTVTYETSEPAVASKVALGEADAGFVYESTAIAAKPGTYTSLTIPKADNYLQTYSIAQMKQAKNSGAAADFEAFMLSDAGQQILRAYGFRQIS